MNIKIQLQQDMKNAMRANNRQRVSVIRMLLTAIEHAQEAMGKQAFSSSNSDGLHIQPDRQQVLSEQAIQDIFHHEAQQRREAVELLRIGGQEEQAETEEAEIAIIEDYLTKVNPWVDHPTMEQAE